MPADLVVEAAPRPAAFVDDVAIVTGGSRGIGLATAAELLRHGARVVLCGRDAEAGSRAVAQLGADGAAFTPCDVAAEDDVVRLVAFCRQRFGTPTLLVNNAGVNANFDATQMTVPEWERFFAVDLRAAWLTAKHVLAPMRQAGRGAIANVSSIHGHATLEGFFPYAAAKSGLVGLTRSLALDWGPHGIRVNAVLPGFTRTRLVEESIDRAGDPGAAEAEMVAGVALRRIADPGEVARTIRFLLSDDASYVTGASLVVDGGLTARRAG